MGTIKYTIDVTNDDEETENVTICMQITANGQEETTSDEWQDASDFTMAAGEYSVLNPNVSICEYDDGTHDSVHVRPRRNGSMVCYEFEPCAGLISYDPLVYYEGELAGAEESEETESEQSTSNTIWDDSVLYLIIGCAGVCLCLVVGVVSTVCCRNKTSDTADSNIRQLSFEISGSVPSIIARHRGDDTL